ncbi:hypothetical protein F2P81_006779 [Scophthalmus maximus]|uniref:RING-type E3 ubiquitin transferase n=1 Tax=Scophthalmus maximus TaxID=52904 RepID=A0A6A4TDD3_SCOMX|nr:hypothetical protein F2P81_006779 [Scophthalmus maximus]
MIQTSQAVDRQQDNTTFSLVQIHMMVRSPVGSQRDRGLTHDLKLRPFKTKSVAMMEDECVKPPVKTLNLHNGFKCPVCSKSVASNEMEVHFIMCLSKPRLSYNEHLVVRPCGDPDADANQIRRKNNQKRSTRTYPGRIRHHP